MNPSSFYSINSGSAQSADQAVRFIGKTPLLPKRDKHSDIFFTNPRKISTFDVGNNLKARSEPIQEYYDAEIEMQSVLDENPYGQTEGAFQGESSRPSQSAASHVIARLNEPHNLLNSTWQLMAT